MRRDLLITWLSDYRNATGKRTGGTFYTEATAMLRPLRLRVRSLVRFEMEGGKAHCPPRDGRVRNQKQKRYYRSDISRGGEHGKQHISYILRESVEILANYTFYFFEKNVQDYANDRKFYLYKNENKREKEENIITHNIEQCIRNEYYIHKIDEKYFWHLHSLTFSKNT